jgi:predicted phage baseplate assembly protein
MALIAPVLDNRTYEQLRDELVGRIPSVAPEWTNHNESDPGRALLELFAHLGESLLFRFNQIPETTKIAFLQLLGVRPRPAQPAHALLAARTDRPTGVQALKTTEAPAGSVLFETDDEVFIWPLDIVAAGKTPDPPHKLSKQEKESRDDALARFTPPVHPDDAQFYHTSVLPADPLAPDATSLDVSAQVDQALWIGLVAKPTTDVTALPNQTAFIGVAFDETIDPPLVLENLDAAGAATYGSANLTRDPPAMTWQIWNGPNPPGRPFTTLSVIGDTTRGLLTSGVIKVVLPPRLPMITGTTDGGPDSPPPLDDSELAAKVIVWLRVSRPPTAQLGDAIGRVRWVGINAVGATQARTATAELLGSGTGDADQQYPLSHRPVLPRTVVLEVEEAAGWVRWTEVDNFALDSFTAARIAGGAATERPYTVDPDTGVVSFGEVKVPQIGERIRVVSYRYGGGAAGNVAAGAITSLTGLGGVEVGNPLPAVGGSDAADVTAALEAIPAIVHRHDRAVIAADFESLAAEVAGCVRADTLARMHPDNPTDEAAGVVSVVVFGPGDAVTAHAPLPDLGLLRRVARYLDARRLVTTELYVIPPEYVEISIAVGLQVRTGYQADAVRRWVDQILRRYLAPLPTGGPDGKGWPLGRDVRRAELEAVAVQVEGVEYLENLRLGRVLAGGIDEDDLIVLEKWQVPAVVGLTVSIGQALEPGVDEEPNPPAQTPVPLPVEVC